MRNSSHNSRRGFTFIELMASLALGMLVVGLTVQLFSQGVDATWVISQRAEMQQDLRATENMLTKDISLAGSGLPIGQGVALASGGGVSPIYGCDQLGNCPPNGAIKYPCANGCPGIPTLFGVMPGWQLGITPPGSPQVTDTISVSYSDVVLALDCYNATITNGTVVTFTLPNPLTCTLPAGLAAPQAINDPVVGLTAGDLVLFQGTNGVPPNTNTFYAVGEVTNVGGGAGTYVVDFGANDPLQMNQPGSANDLSQYAGNTVLANRIFVITYYLQVQPDPLGATGFPVLMRQVSGHTAVPVTENIVNMQYTYDTSNAAGGMLNYQPDGGESAGLSLSLIRQINIEHLSIRSQLSGARGSLYATSGYQGFDLQTSISARNLSYTNRY
jgi:hypothetical protein